MPRHSERFLNRELSWLEFNRRVLEEALDPGVPLLERLRFLSITGSNLDEFFMVRVGGLQQLLEEGRHRFDPAGLTTSQQLTEISRRTHQLVAEQHRCLLEEIEPRLADAGIRRLAGNQLEPDHLEYLERLFLQEIYPVLTPWAIEQPADFPLLPGLGLNLAIRLRPATARGRKPRFAIITLPRRLNRILQVPVPVEGFDYILLEDVVSLFLHRLLAGEPIEECVPFRFTRNADMGVREDLAGDLLSQMRSVLDQRKRSDCVRLEIRQPVSAPLLGFLRSALKVRAESIYEVPGPLDLAAMRELANLKGFDALKYDFWTPQRSPDVPDGESLFDLLSRRNVLLVHPYESFEPMTRLLEQAAEDPQVLAIKQILYRTSENSPIVAALMRAAARGKHVTAVVELKARFDEARNIDWARALERAGVQVIYGLKNLKIHAKLCIIVRREPTGVRRYLHFGTGNYNEITARLYSDVSYLTADEDYGADASAFFNTITAYSQPVPYRKLAAAPLGLRARLLELIDSETQRCKQGQEGRILAKLNSLLDAEVIRALYRASQAGVSILLNIRGICCLRPGVPGLSENIQVLSIVDRFLEHSRIFYFHHGGDPLVFISSADWMPRNLDRRVELMVPVDDPAARERLVAMLRTTFQENVKARWLQPDGSYRRATGPGKAVRTQEVFFRQAQEAARQAKADQFRVFEPQRPAAPPPSR